MWHQGSIWLRLEYDIKVPIWSMLECDTNVPSGRGLNVTSRFPSGQCLNVTPRFPSDQCLNVTPRFPSGRCLNVTPRFPSGRCLNVTSRFPSGWSLNITPKFHLVEAWMWHQGFISSRLKCDTMVPSGRGLTVTLRFHLVETRMWHQGSWTSIWSFIKMLLTLNTFLSPCYIFAELRLSIKMVNPPFFGRQMPGHFKWYSGCRGLGVVVTVRWYIPSNQSMLTPHRYKVHCITKFGM